jgi:ABC-type Mn2+/Zn2+ transport system ATPase subunit
MLYRTKMEYLEWQQRRHDRMVLLAGKFNFPVPQPLPCPEGMDQKEVSLIKVENVRFSYDVAAGLPFIFDNPISYEIKVGTRVGIMGPNGAGKSTFLKLITGKLEPTEGNIITNPEYKLAYFGQHSTKELTLTMTPFEFMCQSFPNANQGELKQHLEKTSISSGPMNTRMENLSFSQRSCVIFSKLTFEPPHLLIMDEPTNFLDLDSVDSLINAANKFNGGLIVVTHNRDFLSRCSKIFLSIVPGAFLEFPTMKAAERATYSFVSALESGKQIDVKNAIVNNRGGGAVHTEETMKLQQARLTAQQAEEKQKQDVKQAEVDRVAKLAAEKEARRLAKVAAQKTDWKPDEKCWVPVQKGKLTTYVLATVKRNVPALGVTVELPDGKVLMIDAKKLKQENPNASVSQSAPAGRGQSAPQSGGRGSAPQKGGGRGNQNQNQGGRGGGGRGQPQQRGRGGGQRGRYAPVGVSPA